MIYQHPNIWGIATASCPETGQFSTITHDRWAQKNSKNFSKGTWQAGRGCEKWSQQVASCLQHAQHLSTLHCASEMQQVFSTARRSWIEATGKSSPRDASSSNFQFNGCERQRDVDMLHRGSSSRDTHHLQIGKTYLPGLTLMYLLSLLCLPPASLRSFSFLLSKSKERFKNGPWKRR